MRRCLGVCFLACILPTGRVEARDYAVYFLGGQSNMDGYGQVTEVPSGLAEQVADVPIFHGNPAPDGSFEGGVGCWSRLRPGHGAGFSSDGDVNSYSNRFGIELTFAAELRRRHPDQAIALIKYSRGGTSLSTEAARHFGCWEPDFDGGSGPGRGINQYDHCLRTLRKALLTRDIDGDGQSDRLIPAGIVWMQGESDAALNQEIAEGYGRRWRRLADLLRAAMHQDDLPVVIGRISDSGRDEVDGLVWDFGEIVRSEQAAWVARDSAAAIVTSTDTYAYSDPWHYDSAGFLDLGRRFAEAADDLAARSNSDSSN